MPRVTVCLAVYNGAATLAKALEAVYRQTFTDFDVLVFDDGSIDNSAQIASSYPCRVIRAPNGGLGEARRRMVEEATGEWVAFVDHDDFWLPRKLQLQMAALDGADAVMIHADGWYVYDDGREVARDLRHPATACSFDHILPDNRIIASTAVFHRQAMLDAGNFVAETIRCSDWYGWLVLAPGRKFIHLPEKVVRYSVLSTSLANAGYRFHQAQYKLLAEIIMPRRRELFAGLTPAQRRRYEHMLVERSGIALSSMARSLEKQGDSVQARVLHRQALKLAPATPRVWTRLIRSHLSR